MLNANYNAILDGPKNGYPWRCNADRINIFNACQHCQPFSKKVFSSLPVFALILYFFCFSCSISSASWVTWLLHWLLTQFKIEFLGLVCFLDCFQTRSLSLSCFQDSQLNQRRQVWCKVDYVLCFKVCIDLLIKLNWLLEQND